MDFEYNVIYSRRKTISVEIDRSGKVTVRAPVNASRKEINSFLTRFEPRIKKARERQITRANNTPVYPESKEEIEALKRQAEKIICPKVDYYASLLGLYPEKVGFTTAKTRFGSCSAKNSINFSCFLVLYPEEAIDYVVVHELCHIKEKNHSPRFYALVAGVMPDYKRRVKMLRGEL